MLLSICLFVLPFTSDVYAGQGPSCLSNREKSHLDGSESEDDEYDGDNGDKNHEEERVAAEVVPYRPLDNPFYNSDLRALLLSYLDVPGLRTFERVNQACRQDAYKINDIRQRNKWAKAGVHLISGVSSAFSGLFKGKGQLFQIQDFMLSGTSKRRMSWYRGVKFCEKVGFQLIAELKQPIQCEVLDNHQWQNIVDLSKKASGEREPEFIPEMGNTFWSKTSFDAAGVAKYTFNGMSFEFGSGLLLPQVLFLLRSEEVYFSVRCACKSSGNVAD